jgi:RNA recognition motif-containing protein
MSTPTGKSQKIQENKTENTTDQNLLKKKRKFGENIEKILTDEQIKLLEKNKRKLDKLKEKKKEKWYAPKVNANIYISGLPKDITEFELTEYFSRCGFIRKDPKTNQNKIKLYKDINGKNKGDALVSFLREESVSMAVDLFNQTEIRLGYRIGIESAKFEQKGESYKKREAYKIDELQRYKMKTDVERMLGWNEDEDNEKGLKIVILKNMFEPIDLIVICFLFLLKYFIYLFFDIFQKKILFFFLILLIFLLEIF